MTDMRIAPPAAPARPILPARLRPAAWPALLTVAGVAVAAAAGARWAGLPWSVPLLSAAAGLALAVAVLAGLWRAGPEARFAPCSRVTLGRAGLAAILVGLLAAPQALTSPAVAWGALGLAVAALLLDGVDGWLARRRGEATDFGARFDMEVDSALTLLLAALALAAGKVGPWVLALGLMRYGFVAAAALRPWLMAPLPDSLRRKTVCVVQVAVLAAILAPVITPSLATWAAAAALGLLVWSFAVDVRWLWRHRVATAP